MDTKLFSGAMLLTGLPVALLILTRVSGLILTAPVFSSRAVPRRMKIALALTVSLLLFPIVGGGAPADLTLARAVSGMLGELLIGAAMGLVLAAVGAGMEFAANLVGQQAGLSLAQVYDPTMNEETTPLGQIYGTVFFMAFLLLGGHRALLAALLDTFTITPLLSFHLSSPAVDVLARVMTDAIILAVRLAAPVLLSMLLVTMAMGFVSRTMPQLNVLSVGFNIKAALLLGLCGLTLGFCDDLLASVMIQAVQDARAAAAGG